MSEISVLIKRNTKLFFKDKALFFTAMITPLILLVLYSTFLGNVYRDSFVAMLDGTGASDAVIDGLVGGQLVSSLLSVSCITVAFCSNMLMVQDKVSGAFGDFCITPVRPGRLAISYFAASGFSTLIIALFAVSLGFIYLSVLGWYLSLADALLIILDVFLLTLLGTGISSVVNHFLSSQGQISAVGSIVSSCYGFICGAYMPISQFSEGLADVLSCLPGTYGTSLLRNHAIRGAVDALTESGVPKFNTDLIRQTTDMDIDFFGNAVPEWGMITVLASWAVLACVAYLVICIVGNKKQGKR